MATTKVRLSLLVKDPEVTEWKDVPITEPFQLITSEPLLAGPISSRVAMLDFDDTGALRPGVPFVPATLPGTFATYTVSSPPHSPDDPIAADFLQTSVFGTVYKTLRLFEEPDALGRRVTWAFDAPQLLVVPAAGKWANACYERDSHSLQFFYFPGPGGKTIFTSHSQDIVAHETAHAIIDGVAPDLYHAFSPQSLAFHEALADIAALLLSFRSAKLRERVLRNTRGRLDDPDQPASAFTGIAEQFAGALALGRDFLRDLRNRKILGTPGMGGRRKDGFAVRRSEPHALSEVLSGALYDVLVRLHEDLKRQYAEASAAPDAGPAWEQALYSSSGKALYVAAERFKRLVLRGLDYLPPGEISFADFGRAMLAADVASHPDQPAQRDWLIQVFVERGIVESPEELSVPPAFELPAVSTLDLGELIASDWVAYRFADSHRAALRIPPDVTFQVKPRLKVKKTYYLGKNKTQEVTECLFKVAWSETEDNTPAPDIAKKRRLTVGTTLAIDWETRRVRALLTGDPRGERASRDELLTHLLASGSLRIGDDASHGGQPQAVVTGLVADGALRLQGTGRLLHVCSPREQTP